MTRRALAAAALALLLAGCSAWDSLFGSSVPALPPAELVPIKPTAELRVLWQGSVGPAQAGTLFPALAGGVVYAAATQGGVTGFDAGRGGVVSRIDLPEPISGGVGVGAGMVLAGTPRGEVLAFDAGGKPLWRTQLSSEVLAPPAAQAGVAVVRTGDGRIHGLDAATGKPRWMYQRTLPALTVRTHAGFVIERGAVFVGFPGGRLVGITLANGKVGWETVVALPRGTTELERVADITSPPVMDGARVCAVAFQGRLGCFEVISGRPVWTRDVSSIAGIAVDDRNVYVTDDRNTVLAFDKNSGASLWRQDRLVRRDVSGPLALGRYVVVGDLQGYVHVISRDDGAFAARIATDGSPIVAPPVALDAMSFLVQTRNGGLYAMTLR